MKRTEPEGLIEKKGDGLLQGNYFGLLPGGRKRDYSLEAFSFYHRLRTAATGENQKKGRGWGALRRKVL